MGAMAVTSVATSVVVSVSVGSGTSGTRGSKVTEQDFLDGLTKVGGNASLSNDLEKHIVQLSVVGDGTGSSNSGTLEGPWLSTRLGRAAADHALGISRLKGTVNTANSDASRQVVQCNEGSQRPIGAAAEKRRTTLRAHLGCCSSCLVEGKLECM